MEKLSNKKTLSCKLGPIQPSISVVMMYETKVVRMYAMLAGDLSPELGEASHVLSDLMNLGIAHYQQQGRKMTSPQSIKNGKEITFLPLILEQRTRRPILIVARQADDRTSVPLKRIR